MYLTDEEAVPEEYIRDILDKDLNLNSLVFYETELLSWPEMAPSRNTLEELYLSSCIIDTDLFKDINIGTILPNLKIFLLRLSEDQPDCSYEDEYDEITGIVQGVQLPDISESNKLQILIISNGHFRFTTSQKGEAPLPQSVETLVLDDVEFVDGSMKMLTSMCPNLKMLAYKGKDYIWPSSVPAWTLLEVLYLDYKDSHDAERQDNIFWNVQLHQYLPNLKIFILTNYWESMLPDMRGCEKLEHVHLTARFTTPLDPRRDMPLPKTLRKLTLGATIFFKWETDEDEIDFGGSELFELMKKHLPECQILQDHRFGDDPDVTFTFRNPERGPWCC